MPKTLPRPATNFLAGETGGLELGPKPPDAVHEDGVVEGDDPAGADQGAVHLEVALHALVRVVAVGEEHVDRLVVKELHGQVEAAGVVRVVADQLDPLAWERERVVEGCEPFGLAAPPDAARQVDADEGRVVGRHAREKEQGPARRRADLQDPARLLLAH